MKRTSAAIVNERTTTMRVSHAAVLLAAALLVSAADLPALPRFAVQTGSKCQACHVNPSGGGMRQAFGAQYGREELPVQTWAQEFELEDVTTLLTNVLGVGADFRTLYFSRQVPDSTGTTSTSQDAFWQMQGDLYLNFRIARKVNLYLKKGLYSGFEIFGLLNILPENGHVKVGKFIPNYGIKNDDHTTFVRTQTGFSPETGRPELTGLEAAVSPGAMHVTAGFYNAADAFGGGSSKKAFLGRAEGIFKLGSEAYAGLGGNVFRKEQENGSITLYGGFGSVSIGDLTLLGEVDLMRTARENTTVSGLIVYGEAGYVLTPGVDLKASYDFYDRDRDVKSGAVSRYSIGLEFFPIGGVEVRPMYRILVEDPKNVPNNELHILFHIYL